MQKIGRTTQDRILDYTLNTLLILVVFIVLYPLYFVAIASFSDPSAVNSGQTLLFPKDITFTGYKYILRDAKIWTGYRNTVLYTVFGTLFALSLTIPSGYALSRKDLPGTGIVMKILVFTMYFSGGLIPLYMVVKSLGLINTPIVLVIMGSFSAYNAVITRTFFLEKIPPDLYEAASLDGCGNIGFFFKIVLPVSKEIVAVIALFYAVGHWNSYFNALIYVNDQNLYSLQLILREMLITSQAVSGANTAEDLIEIQKVAETIKYGVVIVSSLPVLILYPLLRRFFVQGVMIGSIKG